MKDISGSIGKILGLLFATLVIGFTAYLTYLLAARLVPGNTILQAMTVVLFDGGALVWFILFLTQARGTWQWAIAGVGFAVGLLGAVIMAGGELLLGQSLVDIGDTTKIGWILIATTVGAALAHATLSYAFHFADPETHNRIENAQKVSKVVGQAYKTARAEIDRQAEDMGKDLAASLVYEARAQLGAAALPHLRRGGDIETAALESHSGGAILNAKARDAMPARAYQAETKAPTMPAQAQQSAQAQTVDPALLAAILAALSTQAAQPRSDETGPLA